MSSTSSIAEPPLRHSPVHDELERLYPRWFSLDGMPVALSLGNADDERARAPMLALCDVSALTRMTLKGPAAADVLAAQQIAVPADIMGTLPLEDGGLIARTGGAEFFLEDGLGGQTVARIVAAVGAGQPGCYRVVRQDASFLLSGHRAAEVLLETCGFDFRRPPEQLVMTRVAGVSCSILFREIGGIGAFQMWLDGTYGEYLWHTLQEIVRELDGAPIGLAACFPDLLRNN